MAAVGCPRSRARVSLDHERTRRAPHEVREGKMGADDSAIGCCLPCTLRRLPILGKPWVFHHVVSRRRHAAGARIKSMRAAFTNAAVRAKLPDALHQHDLRHRRVTTWLAEGKNPVHVKEAVGHADLRTTRAIRISHVSTYGTSCAPRHSSSATQRSQDRERASRLHSLFRMQRFIAAKDSTPLRR